MTDLRVISIGLEFIRDFGFVFELTRTHLYCQIPDQNHGTVLGGMGGGGALEHVCLRIDSSRRSCDAILDIGRSICQHEQKQREEKNIHKSQKV